MNRGEICVIYTHRYLYIHTYVPTLSLGEMWCEKIRGEKKILSNSDAILVYS